MRTPKMASARLMSSQDVTQTTWRGKSAPYPARVTGSRSAAFFDLDKTVIAKSSTLAFGRPFYKGGLVNRRAVLKSSYAQFVYLLQGADEESMDRMRDYLQAMCIGWPVEQVNAIVAETLHELIDPMVYAEAVALFDEHHEDGLDVVIVSSSGEEVVGPIGAMLGVDHVVATRMVVVDGRYTGEIAFYAYGEAKAAAIRELAEQRGYDLAQSWAYSDSWTDRPMLEAVGNPVAVNPDKPLRRHAAEQGWRLREFRRPVRMRRTRLPALPQPPGPPAAYAGVAVAAGAAGLAWWAGRRR
jgi:HAD superfamily hydrolase (TIGR01490 family)